MQKNKLPHFLTILTFVLISCFSKAQNCGDVQNLSSTQQSQGAPVINLLDTALKYENLNQIDSLSAVLKNIYSTEGGQPDALESYYNLSSDTSWLDLNNSLLLSHLLIGADSMVYVNLWKLGKGMYPPNYLPHSVFLRAGAEVAAGLLKIADKETDLNRKTLYTAWATRALDSLATMQLPSGAFPFPDLRTYNDPTFTPIIQNFINSCGSDSVNVLQNGWIIDDKGTGEFKFDAGVICNVYYEAYQYTGNVNYKNIAINIGNYLKNLKFNLNYNYNTFVALGLIRAYQLNGDITLRDRALQNLRYAVQPGQLVNGRWVDGHNANSRYHALMIYNIVPVMNGVNSSDLFYGALDTMIAKAVQNMKNYSFNCGAATGYRWAMKSWLSNSTLISNSLHDSIGNWIGRHIQQSDSNYKFLDVPTLGEYLELLGNLTSVKNETKEFEVTLFPNPVSDLLTISSSGNMNAIYIYDAAGKLIHSATAGSNYTFSTSGLTPGIYVVKCICNKSIINLKLVKQ